MAAPKLSGECVAEPRHLSRSLAFRSAFTLAADQLARIGYPIVMFGPAAGSNYNYFYPRFAATPASGEFLADYPWEASDQPADDPIIRHALNSPLPVSWDSAEIQSILRDKRNRSYARHISNCRIRHGITLVVHGPRRQAVVGSVLCYDAQPPSDFDLRDARHSISDLAHAYWTYEPNQLRAPIATNATGLQPEDLEIVRTWADGVTQPKQVAHRLATSTNTYYKRRRRVLGLMAAKGEIEAIITAHALGLVQIG
jgi:DNA-binding CsgD family transcriptional regulator